MKKLYTTLALMLIIGIGVSQAQTVTDSWAFGFGLSYPRFSSVNIKGTDSNYGAYLSMQRNFSEYVGLRLKLGYSHLEGEWTDAALAVNEESTNLMTGDIDLLYYFVPCERLSPYAFGGVGINHKTIDNGQTVYPDDNKVGTHLSVGAGVEYKINSNWNVVTEFGYHVTNNSELEGTIAPTEVNGRDSYIAISAGMNFIFGHGGKSELCEPCKGITSTTDSIDYARIEDMIIRHIPKEVIVDNYIYAISEDRLVLIGVNFAFDKSDLLPESYPVLDQGVKLLKDSPEVDVEIEGYTDWIGTAEYNQTLSEERAMTVKKYLVSKGISESRLTTIGYGKGNPIVSNETDEGRAMNRRIVFRIIK